MSTLCMPSTKIRFKNELWEFMELYKEATGISIQKFVEEACETKKEKLEIEQLLKDKPYTK